MRPCGAALLLAAVSHCLGYSVLSHEAIIDALWDVRLRPILLERFRSATPEQLKQAHGYAYGGAIIQDMGYYPHGNGYFSDLTHYARSADFIAALLSDAKTLDEYAFALGALSHYAADNDGHRLATNIAEPMVYPKLARKFGNVVTYEDDPYRHLQTEYAFDVEEVAMGHYAPAQYHDFIGFYVARPLLERAFRETYGFDLKDMFDVEDAIGSYRHTLSTLIPFFTRVAWAKNKDEIRRARPSMTKRRFLYVMKRSSYEREWGRNYDRPSLWDRILAFIVKILPPIGQIRILKFRVLTHPAQQLFMRSFAVAARDYGSQAEAANRGVLQLENQNFDVGAITKPGQYFLQDDTYAYWLNELASRDFAALGTPVARDVLAYYQDPGAQISTKKDPKKWHRVLQQLDRLKAAAQTAINPTAAAEQP